MPTRQQSESKTNLRRRSYKDRVANMNRRLTQFGVRKNPDSPRVHGLRLSATRRIVKIAEPVTETKLIDFSIAEPYVSGGPPFEERTN
jgi:hypothetical protein